jgi:uncharacterized membrane protein YtjA (UPF0391 family)
VIALVAGLLGVSGVAAVATNIAYILSSWRSFVCHTLSDGTLAP